MNRSITYEYLRNDAGLEVRYIKIGTGQYPVLVVPYTWDNSYLLINNMRFTDFQSIILFSHELVVRFYEYDDSQVNIPYGDIEYLEVREDLNLGFIGLHNDKKVQR